MTPYRDVEPYPETGAPAVWSMVFTGIVLFGILVTILVVL